MNYNNFYPQEHPRKMDKQTFVYKMTLMEGNFLTKLNGTNINSNFKLTLKL